MFFRLTNASLSFQEYINKILTKKLDIFAILYLDNIFIYTDNDRDSHVLAVRSVLEQFKKFLLYANLKKYRFHNKEVWLISYMVFLKGIYMEDKRIKAVKQWPEPKLIQDI